MGSMDSIYGGNTLKAEDLPQDFRKVMRVESVEVQQFDKESGGSERKLVLRFVKASKGLALNVTNANMMAEITGSRDYERWVGCSVVVYRTMTDYAGRRVPAIRLDHAGSGTPPPAPPMRHSPPPPPPPPPADDFQASDEDVPF